MQAVHGSNVCYLVSYTYLHIVSNRGAPIIGSAIGNTLYQLIFHIGNRIDKIGGQSHIKP